MQPSLGRRSARLPVADTCPPRSPGDHNVEVGAVGHLHEDGDGGRVAAAGEGQGSIPAHVLDAILETGQERGLGFRAGDSAQRVHGGLAQSRVFVLRARPQLGQVATTRA